MKKIAVLASGSATGGGSGFEKLVETSRSGHLGAEVVCVLSNHPKGGVYERAKRLGIRFVHFKKPWTGERCYELIDEEVDLVCMSGWLKLTQGLDPTKTINIHPGPLPTFGGKGMHGIHVHKAVLNAYKRGEVSSSAVSMHFVTDGYDEGPLFFQRAVSIEKDDTVESLGKRVSTIEHLFQWRLTKRVLNGTISWDGKNPDSLRTT